MKKIWSIFALTALCVMSDAGAEGLPFGSASSTTNSMVIKDKRLDFLAGKNEQTNEVDVTSWPRDKVFMSVGSDVFLWGPVWDYVEIYLNAKPISVPPGSTLDDIKTIKEKLALVVARKTAKLYIGGALLAQKAKEMGLSEADSQYVRTNLVAQYLQAAPEKYRQRVADRLFCPGGYYTHCIDTMLLGDAYREVVLKPQIKISEEEIQASIHTQELKNVMATNLNEKMGKAIESMRADIVAGKISFADAARKYSDCESGEMGGYWGRFDPEDNQLLDEIKRVVFDLPTNTISKVVETPLSYHIFKVLGPTEPLPVKVDDDDDDDDDEDGDASDGSIRLCHIMFEKNKIKPVLSPDEMRKRLFDRKMNELVIATQKKLAQEIPVECALEDVKESFLRQGRPENVNNKFKTRKKGQKP